VELWRGEAFHWQRRRSAFHWNCRRPAFHRNCGRATFHRNCGRATFHGDGSRRATFHRQRRGTAHLHVAATIGVRLDAIAQRLATPGEYFCQPSFLVGRRVQRREQRSQYA
jgi:hypothetical protein